MGLTRSACCTRCALWRLSSTCGLRAADADADAQFVRLTAAAWNLPCTVEHANVSALAEEAAASLEEAAREARYAFLGRLALELGAAVVAVGHNADDQAETVLMHFLRGSGLAGLRGMQPCSAFPFPTLPAFISQRPSGQLHLIRPLLSILRLDILDYCHAHGLTPRFDDSNDDVAIFRNRLRHELLPRLEQYNPQIKRILGNTAAVLADEHSLLRANLLAAWPAIALEEDDGRLVLDLPAWRRLPLALQRAVLREAIHRLRASLRNIAFIHIDNALWLLRGGQTGDRMTLPAGLEVVLGYDRFVIGNQGAEMPPGDLPQMNDDRLPLLVPGTTALAGWVVETALMYPAALPPGWQTNADPWQATLDADVLGRSPALRTRQPGDRFQPLGMAGRSKLLAELFTNAKIPAPARDRWPLLVTTSGDIAWVCGLRLDERAKVTAATATVMHISLRPLRAGQGAAPK